MIGAFAGGLAKGVGQGLNIYEQLQRVSEENRKRQAQDEIASYTQSAQQRGEKPATFFKTLGELYAPFDPQASVSFSQMAQQQDEIEDHQFLAQGMAGAATGDPAMTAQGMNAYFQKKSYPWTVAPATDATGAPTVSVSTPNGQSTMFDAKDWTKRARAYIAILAMGPDKGALFPEEQQSAQLTNQGQGLKNELTGLDVQYGPREKEAGLDLTGAQTGNYQANTAQTNVETQLLPEQAAAENASRYASAASARQNVAESQALLPGRVRGQGLELEQLGYQNQAAAAGLPYIGRTAEAKIRGEEADATYREAQAKYAGQTKTRPRRFTEDDYGMAADTLAGLAGAKVGLDGGIEPVEGAEARYPNLRDPGAMAEVKSAAVAIGEQNNIDLTMASTVAARIDAGEYQLHPTEDPNFYAVQTESGGIYYVPAAVAEQFIDMDAVNPGVSE